jgi:hypothetical protein
MGLDVKLRLWCFYIHHRCAYSYEHWWCIYSESDIIKKIISNKDVYQTWRTLDD